jgi:hypothetical protein
MRATGLGAVNVQCLQKKAEGAADYVSRHSQNGIGYSHRRQGSPTRVCRRRRVGPGGDYIFSRLSRALMTSARAACRRLICLRRDTRKLPTASDRPREGEGISICRRPLDRPSGCCRLVFCSPNRNWWSSSRGNKTSSFYRSTSLLVRSTDHRSVRRHSRTDVFTADVACRHR